MGTFPTAARLGRQLLLRSNGGTFTVEGIFVSTSDSVYAQNGGKVQLAALQQDVHQNGVTLYVYDSTSSIEIGTAGGAAGGTITIDSGSSVTESGTFYAPTIVDNGALTVAAGETLYMEGALGGSGSVTIDAGSTLTVYGASASGTDTIAFAGAGGTLELGDDPGLPNGMTLTGWASGENLDVRGVTDAAYVSGKSRALRQRIDGWLVQGRLDPTPATHSTSFRSATATRRSRSARAGRTRSAATSPRPRTGAPGRFPGRRTASRSRRPEPIRCR